MHYLFGPISRGIGTLRAGRSHRRMGYLRLVGVSLRIALQRAVLRLRKVKLIELRFPTGAMAMAALVVSGLAGPSASVKAWSRPMTVGRGADLSPPVLAASPSRGATVAWRRDFPGALVARRISPAGSLGAPRLLASRTSRAGPWLALSRAGTTIAVWYDDKGFLLARRMARSGSIGRVVQVSPVPAVGDYGLQASVAVDGAGNATIAWPRLVVRETDPYGGVEYLSATVHARRLMANGRLSPVIDLPSGGRLASSPRVAVARSGRASVTWQVFRQDPVSLYAATIGRNGSVGPARELTQSAPPLPGYPYELASNARGDVAVVWISAQVMARRIAAGGKLGPVDTIGPVKTGEYTLPLDVGIDRTGNATVVWQNAPLESPANLIRSRRIDTLDRSGALRKLYDAPLGAMEPRVAVDAGGTAVAAWVRVTMTGDDPAYSLKARAISRRGQIERTRTIAPRSLGFISAPELVMDEHGIVTVAWWDLLDRRDPRIVIRVARMHFAGPKSRQRMRDLEAESSFR